MKFAGARALFFLPFFFLGIFFSRDAAAQEGGSGQVQQQIEEIQTRLAAIETQQQALLAQKDKIP